MINIVIVEDHAIFRSGLKKLLSEIKEFLSEDERPRITKEKYMEIIFDTPFKDASELSTINNLLIIPKREE